MQPIPPPTQAVRVPRDLSTVRASVLEDYVRARILQFIRALSLRLLANCPAVTVDLLDSAVREALQSIPAPEYGPVPVEALDLQLVFRHDCLSLGCLEESCALCQYNTERRCKVNFAPKYLVNERLQARCGATIRIELLDRATGQLFEGELADIVVELLALDGNLYDQKFLGEASAAAAARDPDAELDECVLLTNNKRGPLLASPLAGVVDTSGRILLSLSQGRVLLPDVSISDSSEALLTGRKPPFRLLVRAVHKDGTRLNNIKHAISEGFVVATRRTRSSNKVEIPSVDDPVSKLEHMGRETVKKLQDLRSAAQQAGEEIDLPDLNSVETVAQFKLLALRAEQDGALRRKLLQVLKLSKDKWEEAREHANRAVVADTRMRVWFRDPVGLDVGVLFPCRMGAVNLEQPAGLLLRQSEPGPSRFQVVLTAHLTPAQRELLRQLAPRAAASWWSSGHSGWSIFPVDSALLEQARALQPTLPGVGDEGAGQLPLAGPPLPPGTAAAAAPRPSSSGHVPGPSPVPAGTPDVEMPSISTDGGPGPSLPAAPGGPATGMVPGDPQHAALVAAARLQQQLLQQAKQQQDGAFARQPPRVCSRVSLDGGSLGSGWPGDAMRPGLPTPQELDRMLASDTLSAATVAAIAQVLHNNTCPPELLQHLQLLSANQVSLTPRAPTMPLRQMPLGTPQAAAAGTQQLQQQLPPALTVASLASGTTLSPFAAATARPTAAATGRPPTGGMPPAPQPPQQGQAQQGQPQEPPTITQLLLMEQRRLAALQGLLSAAPQQQQQQKQQQQQQQLRPTVVRDVPSSSRGEAAASGSNSGHLQVNRPFSRIALQPAEQQQQQQQLLQGLRPATQSPVTPAQPAVGSAGEVMGPVSLQQTLMLLGQRQQPKPPQGQTQQPGAPVGAPSNPASGQGRGGAFADSDRSLSGKKRQCLSSASLESPLSSPEGQDDAGHNAMAAALQALGQAATGAGASGGSHPMWESGQPGSSVPAAAAGVGALGGDVSTRRPLAAAPDGASPPAAPAAQVPHPMGGTSAFYHPAQEQIHPLSQPQQQPSLASGPGLRLSHGLTNELSLDLPGLSTLLQHEGASHAAPALSGLAGMAASGPATHTNTPQLQSGRPGLVAGGGAPIAAPAQLPSLELDKFMSFDTSLPLFSSAQLADHLLSRMDLPAPLAASSTSPTGVAMPPAPSLDLARIMSLDMLASWPAELSMPGAHQPQNLQHLQGSMAVGTGMLSPTTSGLDTMQSMADVLEQLKDPSGAPPPPGAPPAPHH